MRFRVVSRERRRAQPSERMARSRLLGAHGLLRGRALGGATRSHTAGLPCICILDDLITRADLRTRLSLLLALMASVGSGGCADALSMRLPEYNPQGRSVCVPAMVALYGVGPHNQLTFLGARSKRDRIMVNSFLKIVAHTNGSRLMDLAEVKDTTFSSAEFYTYMDKLLDAIDADHRVGMHRPLSEWGPLPPPLASWGAPLQVSYVWFVRFTGGYETDEQKSENTVNMILGAPTITGRRMAMIGVIDLQTLRLIRLEAKPFSSLESADDVDLIVNELIQAIRNG